jgi:hypothetical protein
MYPTIVDYLNDPAAQDRPVIPPGGSCGPKDDDHMTFLAMVVRRQRDRSAQIDILHRQAVLLESFAPGDPCVARMIEWHAQLAEAKN